MLKLKLVPTGKKHQIHYRVCVATENSKLTGTVVEVLGHYHPLENHALTLEKDRVSYWLNLGAQPTSRVRKLISKTK
jgi:small subunit ribosomal protein S16